MCVVSHLRRRWTRWDVLRGSNFERVSTPWALGESGPTLFRHTPKINTRGFRGALSAPSAHSLSLSPLLCRSLSLVIVLPSSVPRAPLPPFSSTSVNTRVTSCTTRCQPAAPGLRTTRRTDPSTLLSTIRQRPDRPPLFLASANPATRGQRPRSRATPNAPTPISQTVTLRPILPFHQQHWTQPASRSLAPSRQDAARAPARSRRAARVRRARRTRTGHSVSSLSCPPLPCQLHNTHHLSTLLAGQGLPSSPPAHTFIPQVNRRCR